MTDRSTAEGLGENREGVRPTAASLINSKNHGRASSLLLAMSVVSAATEQERSIAHAQYRLRFLGDPVLKIKADDVQPDTDVSELIYALKRILKEETGMGLAAQQVGSLWRVALMVLFGQRHLTINPRIVEKSEATVISKGEGCLSVQSHKGHYFRTDVRRREWVRLAYLDEQRGECERLLTGMDAIVAQHECDHLDGRCIVDGLSRQQRRQAERFVGGRTRNA